MYLIISVFQIRIITKAYAQIDHTHTTAPIQNSGQVGGKLKANLGAALHS